MNCLCVLALLFGTVVADEPAVEIPLGQVWALDMPGTRDIRELFADGKEVNKIAYRMTLERIFEKLNPDPPRESERGLAIAIFEGWPSELHSIDQMLRFSRRSNVVPVTEDVGIVFFSNASPYRAEIEKVERKGTLFTVHYRVMPTPSEDGADSKSVSLAVIPLGKLPAGSYRIELERSPSEEKFTQAGLQPLTDEQADRIVCKPFSFEVWQPPEPDPGLSAGAVEIPLDQIWATDIQGARNIRDLDWTQLENQPLSSGSLEALYRLDKDHAESGFVVAGEGQEALIAAHRQLPPGEKPSNVLPAGKQISIVYFTHSFAHLHRVERRNNTINILFNSVISDAGFFTQLALIPLGKLAAGEYEVNVIGVLPVENEGLAALSLTEPHLQVCQPFSFTIVGQNKAEP